MQTATVRSRPLQADTALLWSITWRRAQFNLVHRTSGTYRNPVPYHHSLPAKALLLVVSSLLTNSLRRWMRTMMGRILALTPVETFNGQPKSPTSSWSCCPISALRQLSKRTDEVLWKARTAPLLSSFVRRYVRVFILAVANLITAALSRMKRVYSISTRALPLLLCMIAAKSYWWLVLSHLPLRLGHCSR